MKELDRISTSVYDTAIIGAGAVGSSLAIGLQKQGLHVALIDRQMDYPAIFRAERASGEAMRMLDSLGGYECVKPHLVDTPLIANYRNSSRLHFFEQSDDVAFHHYQFVRSLQEEAKARTDFVHGEVNNLNRSERSLRITVGDGQCVSTRSLVVASGVDRNMQKMLGLHVETVAKNFSFSYGGNIALEEKKALPFVNAVFWNHKADLGTGYMNIFQLKSCIRFNFFVFWPSKDLRHRRVMRGGDSFLEVMEEVCPEVRKTIGAFSIEGKPQGVNISLTRIDNSESAGVFLAGDASGRSCPSFGFGLHKGLNDASILNELIPEELTAYPGLALGSSSVAKYTGNPDKRDVDRMAEKGSFQTREASIGTCLKTRILKARIKATPGWMINAVRLFRSRKEKAKLISRCHHTPEMDTMTDESRMVKEAVAKGSFK